MNARERWQALQAHLAAARAAESAGDHARARAEVDAALAIDPAFLAAQALRDTLPETSSLPPPSVPPEPPRAAPPPPIPEPVVSLDGYARFEERAKQRRLARRVASAHEALARRRLDVAAAAIEDARELDPGSPIVGDLAQALAAARRPRPPRTPRGVTTVAAASALLLCAASRLGAPMRLPLAAVRVAAPVSLALPAAPAMAVIQTARREEPEPAGAPGPIVREQVVHPQRVVDAAPDRAADRAVRVESPPPAPPVAAPVTPPRPAVSEAPVEPESRPAAPVRAPVETTAAAGVPRLPLPPRPVAPPPANEEALVRVTLQRYQAAYDVLDARSAQAVWPAVDERALAHAFEGLSSQRLQFDACNVRTGQGVASATCRGTATYVAKVGSRDPRVEPRVWYFTLRKQGGEWKIESARAER